MSLSNKPTVQDVLLQSAEGAAAMAAEAMAAAASANPPSLLCASTRILRPRGGRVDYGEINDEDDYSVRDPKSKLYVLSP